MVERDWFRPHRKHSYGRCDKMLGVQWVMPVGHNMGHIVCWGRWMSCVPEGEVGCEWVHG